MGAVGRKLKIRDILDKLKIGCDFFCIDFVPALNKTKLIYFFSVLIFYWCYLMFQQTEVSSIMEYECEYSYFATFYAIQIQVSEM